MRGLSFSAFALETLAYAITSAYSWRNGFPFSTYGENVFLSIQNTLVTLLIVAHSTPTARRLTTAPTSTGKVAATGAAALATVITLAVIPDSTLYLLQVATLPLSLFSKLPQIVQNQRAHSTGMLSTFAVAAQVLGCAARLFTTFKEVNDAAVAAGFGLALVLNVALAIQVVAFWGNDGARRDSVSIPLRELGDRKNTHQGVDIVVPPQSPAPVPSGYEALRQSPGYQTQTGRKWSRKVD